MNINVTSKLILLIVVIYSVIVKNSRIHRGIKVWYTCNNLIGRREKLFCFNYVLICNSNLSNECNNEKSKTNPKLKTYMLKLV